MDTHGAPITAPAVEIRQLRHRFGRTTALAGVDLTVRTGEVYGFLGLNGAGKTTTIRLLLGLLRLQSGSVRMFGESVSGHPLGLYRQVAFLMETYVPLPYLSARGNLWQQARVLGLPRDKARERIESLLRRVHLFDVRHRKTRKFSMGMRRRLGLAGALLGSPRLLILDEPSNGLDPQGVHDLRDILERTREEGVTVLLSSHQLQEAERLCDRFGVLHEGRLLFEGSMESIHRAGSSQLEILATDGDAALERLRKQPWCRDARLATTPGELAPMTRAAPAAQPRRLVVEIDPQARDRVAACLVEGGVSVLELRPVDRSLERFFHETIARAGSASSQESVA